MFTDGRLWSQHQPHPCSLDFSHTQRVVVRKIKFADL